MTESTGAPFWLQYFFVVNASTCTSIRSHSSKTVWEHRPLSKKEILTPRIRFRHSESAIYSARIWAYIFAFCPTYHLIISVEIIIPLENCHFGLDWGTSLFSPPPLHPLPITLHFIRHLCLKMVFVSGKVLCVTS